jgi:hypothetical protein
MQGMPAHQAQQINFAIGDAAVHREGRINQIFNVDVY